MILYSLFFLTLNQYMKKKYNVTRIFKKLNLIEEFVFTRFTIIILYNFRCLDYKRYTEIVEYNTFTVSYLYFVLFDRSLKNLDKNTCVTTYFSRFQNNNFHILIEVHRHNKVSEDFNGVGFLSYRSS